ncbi:hypothetical protein Btru_033534 [Bulinus truncatus]|nr:hypothetical protein Btru_033534 [Bulinus truncatus]
MRLTFKEKDLIKGFSLEFNTSTSVVRCIDQKLTLVNNNTIDVWCSLNALIQEVNIIGEGVRTLCSIYVSGGRNVALKQPTHQTSTYDNEKGETLNSLSLNAVDGNVNGKFTDGSCSHTNKSDPSPTWTVTFNVTFSINKFVLYNRGNTENSDNQDNLNKERLKHFILKAFGENSAELFNYTDKSIKAKKIYTVNQLILDRVANVSITATTEYAGVYLTLCEVEIFGDCPDGWRGLKCEQECNKEDNFCNRICFGASDPPDCNTNCTVGMWGLNCSNNCTERCKGYNCDKINGLCRSGCNGYSDPPYCSQACNIHQWGLNCSQTCSKTCQNRTCNITTGKCLLECLPGFLGDMCDKVNMLFSALQKEGDNTNISVIVGPIAAGALLVCLIVLGVIIWRRRRGVARKKDTVSERTNVYEHTLEHVSVKEDIHGKDNDKYHSEAKDNLSGLDGGYYNAFEVKQETSILVSDFNEFMKSHQKPFFTEQFEGFNNKVEFIASQGPNLIILNDFVRMLWEQKVAIVVMLTNLIEEGKMKCEKYWPDEGKNNFGDIKMRLVTTFTYSDYTIRKLELVKKNEDTHHLVHYQFHAWPDKSVPVSTWSLVDFAFTVSDNHSSGITVVHCSAGVGRTGTFIALLNILAQAKATGKMNFLQTVTKLRQDRVFMVQTSAQYEFLHKVTQASLLCIDTPVDEMTSGPHSGNKMRRDNRIEVEFKNLCAVCSVVNKEEHLDEDNGDNVYQNTQKISLEDKNRFPSISPSVRFRPYLNTSHDITEDYINAVIIQGVKQRDQYFLTQLPMSKTVDDFWRLVTQYKINVIVAFEMDDFNKDKTVAKFLPSQSEKDFETPLFKLSCDTQRSKSTLFWDEQRLTVTCKHEIYSERHDVISLQASFKDLTATKWLSLMKHVKKCYAPDGNVVYLCKNGAEFSGLASTLSMMLERMDSETKVSVPLVVGSMKLIRPEVIASVEQYKLIYEFLSHLGYAEIRVADRWPRLNLYIACKMQPVNLVAHKDNWLMDENDSTCNEENSNEVSSKLKAENYFTWMRLTFKEKVSINGFSLEFNTSTLNVRCIDQKMSLINNNTIDVRCSLNALIQEVNIIGEGVRTLCSVYVSGENADRQDKVNQVRLQGFILRAFGLNSTELFDYKDTNCTIGLWGLNCTNNCTEGCKGSNCDNINGLCRSGCNGYSDPPHCFQGPNSTNLNDFVRMLWEQKAETVVMLTNLIEEGKIKCEKYWPDEEETNFGDIKMRLVNTFTYSDYSIRKLELIKKNEDTHHLVHYQFHAWPDKSVPISTWSLVDFVFTVSDNHSSGITVVHCSDGEGRTGIFIALLNILAQAMATGKMNFSQTVAKLRQDRVFMVQTSAQYEFLHKVTQASLLCMDTPVDEMTSGPHSGSKMRRDNRIEEEFKNLCAVSSVINKEEQLDEDNGDNVYQNTQKISLEDKNRFPSISPSVRFRPYLNTSNDITEDYINAVIIQGVKQRDQYFLTQLPMSKTVDDFWRLVTQYKIKVIVAFEMDDFNKDKTVAKFLPSQSEKDFETPLFKLSCDTQRSKSTLLWDEQRLTVTCKHEIYSERHDVISLHASFKDLTATKWLSLVKHVKKCYAPDGKVVYLCKNGSEFSGLASTLSMMLERMDSEMKVSVPLVVGSMKLIRPEVIASVEQYKLIYEVLSLRTETSNQYTNIGDRFLKETL